MDFCMHFIFCVTAFVSVHFSQKNTIYIYIYIYILITIKVSKVTKVTSQALHKKNIEIKEKKK